MKSSKRSFWPWAIVLWFVIFGGAMAAWAVVATAHKIDLVHKNYYEDEIRFQQQLDRQNRAQLLRREIAITLEGGRLFVRLPASHSPEATGRISFYRPSEAGLDREFPLALDAEGRQSIDVRSLRAGLWRIRAQWTASGQDYFVEQPIVLGSAPVSP